MRKPKVDWIRTRIMFEIEGAPVTEIARQCCVSRKSVYAHLRREHWARDMRRTVRNRAQAMVAGQGVSPRSAADVARIIEQEAGRVAGIIHQHRADWHDVEALEVQARRAHEAGDEVTARKVAELVRLSASTLKIVQDNERICYGLDSGDPPQEVTDAELEAAIESAGG